MLVFLALSIWGAVALHSRGAEQCLEMPVESGCQDFHRIARVNVIVGFIYIALHCCSWPCAIGAIVMIE